jgi:hypothetical protein
MRLGVRLAVLCAGVFAPGCGFAQKPYANDPLLRSGRAVWVPRDAPVPVPTAPIMIEAPRPRPAPPVTSRWE